MADKIQLTRVMIRTEATKSEHFIILLATGGKHKTEKRADGSVYHYASFSCGDEFKELRYEFASPREYLALLGRKDILKLSYLVLETDAATGGYRIAKIYPGDTYSWDTIKNECDCRYASSSKTDEKEQRNHQSSVAETQTTPSKKKSLWEKFKDALHYTSDKKQPGAFGRFCQIIFAFALGCSAQLWLSVVMVGIYEGPGLMPDSSVGVYGLTLAVCAAFFWLSLWLMGTICRNRPKTYALSLIVVFGELVLLLFGMLLSWVASILESFSASSMWLWVFISLVLIISMIVSVKNGKKTVFWWFLIGELCNTVIAVLALCNLPEFIRRIKGADFISLWSFYTIFVMVIACLIGVVVFILTLRSYLKSVTGKQYSDEDLMLLRGFDRFQISGYYLYKAMLNGIVSSSAMYPSSSSDESEMIRTVKLSDTLSDEQLSAYLFENPLSHEMLSWIYQRQNSNDADKEGNTVRFTDAIYYNDIDPVHTTECGTATAKIIKRTKNLFVGILFGALFIMCLGLLSKTYLGIRNGKDCGNLVVMWMFVVPVTTAILWAAFQKWLHTTTQKVFVNVLIEDLKNREKNITTQHSFDLKTASKTSREEAEHLLRAYILCDYPQKIDYKQGESVTSVNNLLTAVLLAKAKYNSGKNGNGGSGCSSCSSCSSCGGCSGCGGCGD